MKTIKDIVHLYNFESTPILKKLVGAHKYLAELKGVAQTIPNIHILISTLALQEAKESSAIENIITTQDEIYKSNKEKKQFASTSAKEVHNYADALYEGYELVKENSAITLNDIIRLQKMIEENDAGIRKLPGTELKNEKTGKTVYTPPQSHKEVIDLMYEFESFLNNKKEELDPLINMGILHHQFESIHPFYDANGRVGRIINVLFLVKEGLLDNPILYLSRSINRNKGDYYRLLQSVRDQGTREERTLRILTRIEETAKHTIQIVQKIKKLMLEQKHLLRSKLPKIYSQELLNNIFKHPYTKIEFLKKDLGCTRLTATKYLDALVDLGFLLKIKKGRENYYLNIHLVELLKNVSS